MRHCLATVTALLVACGCSAGSPDAGPCEDGRPGVRVQITTQIPSPFPATYVWITTGGRKEPVLHTTLETDTEGQRSFRAAYPAGAVAGPAAIDYLYPGPGVGDTVGHTEFTADPTACVSVEMQLVYCCLPDAGVPDSPDAAASDAAASDAAAP